MDITVSLANKKDIESLSALFHQVSLIHYKNMPETFKPPQKENDTKYILETIDQKDAFLFKAERGNVLCGYLILYINRFPTDFFVHPVRGFISSIGVDERYRRQGIGKKMIKKAEEFLKEQKIGLMELDVYTFNTAAEMLYDQLGYKDIKQYKSKIL